MPDVMTRLWKRVDVTVDGCWTWTGGGNGIGHGKIHTPNGRKYVHRLTYEAAYGPIPEGLEIDHLCRNRGCVRPDHLEAVTHEENVRRGDSGKWITAKTHCPQGHPYAGDNLRVDSLGRRLCVTCTRITRNKYNVKYRARKRGET